jgi:hypothetical protein
VRRIEHGGGVVPEVRARRQGGVIVGSRSGTEISVSPWVRVRAAVRTGTSMWSEQPRVRHSDPDPNRGGNDRETGRNCMRRVPSE